MVCAQGANNFLENLSYFLTKTRTSDKFKEIEDKKIYIFVEKRTYINYNFESDNPCQWLFDLSCHFTVTVGVT